MSKVEADSEQSILWLQELVRFRTVSADGPHNGSYLLCAEWLQSKLSAIGLSTFILPESATGKPIVVGTWAGEDPSLPCVVLNSHYDVVPVAQDCWSVPAFDGLRENGRVYGRGTQDMKCVCAQYLSAVSALASSGFRNRRTVHLTFVPDEEIGGKEGMEFMINSEWFRNLDIAIALDEGLASVDNKYSIFYGERLNWWIHIKATGNTGHGSRFIDGTAVEQVVGVVNKALEFRCDQLDLLHGRGRHAGCNHAIARKLGDVTSLNVTMLRAGVSAGGKDIINVIPPTAEAGFDVRIAPHVPPSEIRERLDQWCVEIQQKTKGLSPGQGLSWDFFYQPLMEHSTTSCSEDENPWYRVIKATLAANFGAEVCPEVFPAATDSRFLRHLGIRAFGFSPMRNIPILLHEHDEYIEESVFVEGCQVYISLLQAFNTVEL